MRNWGFGGLQDVVFGGGGWRLGELQAHEVLHMPAGVVLMTMSCDKHAIQVPRLQLPA